jgi:YggT family protein
LLPGIVDALFALAWLVFIARAILSWLPIDPRNPVAAVVFRITEPVLQPIRRILPRTGPLDLSMLVVFVLLIILQYLVQSVL